MGELITEFLSEKQRIFFFLVRPDTIAGVFATMTRVEADIIYGQAGTVSGRRHERLQSSFKIGAGKIRHAAADHEWKGKPDLDAIDLSLSGIDVQHESG